MKTTIYGSVWSELHSLVLHLQSVTRRAARGPERPTHPVGGRAPNAGAASVHTAGATEHHRKVAGRVRHRGSSRREAHSARPFPVQSGPGTAVDARGRRPLLDARHRAAAAARRVTAAGRRRPRRSRRRAFAPPAKQRRSAVSHAAAGPCYGPVRPECRKQETSETRPTTAPQNPDSLVILTCLPTN